MVLKLQHSIQESKGLDFVDIDNVKKIKNIKQTSLHFCPILYLSTVTVKAIYLPKSLDIPMFKETGAHTFEVVLQARKNIFWLIVVDARFENHRPFIIYVDNCVTVHKHRMSLINTYYNLLSDNLAQQLNLHFVFQLFCHFPVL